MFEYCQREVRGIILNIGQFLSRNVGWEDEKGDLVDYKQVNSWDREALAIRYLEEYVYYPKDDGTYTCIGGVKNKRKFIQEAAIKIDEFIPKTFFIKYAQKYNTYEESDGSVLKRMFKNKDAHDITKNLIYGYPQNEKPIKEDRSVRLATSKQISYIQALGRESGYELVRKDEITVASADALIKFLRGERTEIADSNFAFLKYE